MTLVTEKGVELSMPEIDAKTKLNMERCADFLAKMLLKYGPEILKETETEKEKN